MPTTRASSNDRPATTSSSKKSAPSTVSVQSNPKERKKSKPAKESDDDSAEETTTMTKAALLTLGGTQYLLSLASKAVHSLHSHYEQQCQTAMTAGDQDSEAAEILYDVELTLRKLDPVCWKELVDKRLESTGGFTSWTATELAHRAKLQTRTTALLALGRTPKAFWVVPEAVKHWRESRGEDIEAKMEDAALDLLIFLSENWERAELFRPMDV